MVIRRFLLAELNFWLNKEPHRSLKTFDKDYDKI